MKNVFVCLLMIITTLSFAQENVSNVFNIQLNPGETFGVNNNSICFKEVLSDSRCPKNVTCVWAGEARVLVDIYENGILKEEQLVVINGNDLALNLVLGSKEYAISGFQLYPYPSINVSVPKDEYRLNLKISENEGEN